MKKQVVYASLGDEFFRYELDVCNATLTKKGIVTMPTNVQFAVAHPSGCYLYVVASNAGNGTLGAAGDKHLLSALKINSHTGALKNYGQPTLLPERPIHVTLDRDGRYILVAFNQSGSVRVYQITNDGMIGEEIAQKERPAGGIFTHQVTVTPANKTVIALGRGNEATEKRAADSGSITTFSFQNGILEKINKSYFEEGLGPRHLAYHPTKPWVYVGVERASKLFMYNMETAGTLSKEPVFKKESLMDLDNVHRDRQKGGCVQIHPNGKFLYTTNRADGVVQKGDEIISAGGENNIAVFKINETTGEPTLIQHIDGQGIEGRTFSIDATGKLFILANQKTLWVRDGMSLKQIWANLAVFGIGNDGKLEFIRKYEMENPYKWLLWMDILQIK
ncbi:MAG: lactonase family protein [Sporomusa sp.]